MSELNDPRVLLAAERTLLAWSRTSLALLAFGFAVERFGLFASFLVGGAAPSRNASFWIGITVIAVGTILPFIAVFQHRQILRSLKPNEIPPGYGRYWGMLTTTIVGLLGVALVAYLSVASVWGEAGG